MCEDGEEQPHPDDEEDDEVRFFRRALFRQFLTRLPLQLFAADFDPTPPSRDERTVHLEVADDKLVAKTPDGTRIGTPALGKSATTPRASPAPKPRASCGLLLPIPSLVSR